MRKMTIVLAFVFAIFSPFIIAGTLYFLIAIGSLTAYGAWVIVLIITVVSWLIPTALIIIGVGSDKPKIVKNKQSAKYTPSAKYIPSTKSGTHSNTSVNKKEERHIFDTSIWVNYLVDKYLNNDDNPNDKISIVFKDNIENILKNHKNIFIPSIVYKEAINVLETKFNQNSENYKSARHDLFKHWDYSKDKYLKMLEEIPIATKMNIDSFNSRIKRLKKNDFEEKLKILMEIHKKIADNYNVYHGCLDKLYLTIQNHKSSGDSEEDKYIEKSNKTMKREIQEVYLLEETLEKVSHLKLKNHLSLFGNVMFQIFHEDTRIHDNRKREISKNYRTFKNKRDDLYKNKNFEAFKDIISEYRKEVNKYILETRIPDEIQDIVKKLTPKDIEFYKEKYNGIGISLGINSDFKAKLIEDIKSCMPHLWIVNDIMDRHILTTAICFGQHEDNNTEVIFRTSDNFFSRYISRQEKLGVIIKILPLE